jgi:mevalonate kinase
MRVESENKVGSFYSRGKLLLSGEYLVLKGAKALALPLKFGQELRVEECLEIDGIYWKSFMYDELWFFVKFNHQLSVIETNKPEVASRLKRILLSAKGLNPGFLSKDVSYKIQSLSNFNFEWGFGSSSTLISNIASWANVDAYELNELTFGGSGFDIACSRNEKPFIYERTNNARSISISEFNPSFKQDLIFVYLGKKQNTQQSIKAFLESAIFDEESIQRISLISEELSNVKDKIGFMNLLLEHETIISKILNIHKIQDQFFSDFDGVVKSLGAWGGDFVLAVSNQSNEYIFDYFTQKGMTTFFKYEEIIP